MEYKRIKILSFMLTLALVIGLLCLSGTASASTTSYQLVTPNENLSLGYDGGYYRIGDLKVTAADSFDTNYKVVVTINRASAFTNQSVDTRPTMSYDLVISPDLTTITSGDSFDFTAASIDAQEGLEIGTVVTADFLTAADGFYMDSLTFRASLALADSASVAFTVKRAVGSSSSSIEDGNYTVATGTTWQQFIDSGNAPACLSIGTSGGYSGKVWHDMNNEVGDCGGTLIANTADNKRVKADDVIIDGATYACSDLWLIKMLLLAFLGGCNSGVLYAGIGVAGLFAVCGDSALRQFFVKH